MKKRILKVVPNSEGEKYFINTYIPICKDKVICSLGSIYGTAWNEYEITENDFNRCREFIIKRDKLS